MAETRQYEPSVLDEHPASAIAAMSPELAAKAAASAYSDDLVERILAVRPDRAMIEQWFDSGFPTPEQAEAWLAETSRTLASTLVHRTATWGDHDMLVDLCANAPERVSDWSVTVERGPNPYAAFRLQEHPNVNVLEDRRVAIGMSASSGRNTYIEGQQTSVNFMSGWRIRDGFRGLGLSNMLRMGAGPGTSFFGLVTYYYGRLENSSAAWLTHIQSEMEDRPDGFGSPTDQLSASLTVFDAPNNAVEPSPAGYVIREASEDDLPRCIELINRTHAGLDLFRPYTRDYIGYRLDDLHWGPRPSFIEAVYGWQEFRVVEHQGQIVACGGLWDRGRDIRERWQRDDTEFVVDPTALMDFGFADGAESAAVILIEHFLAESSTLERSGMLAALEFLPELQQATSHLSSRLDTRSLHVTPLRMPDLSIDLQITRPYTDIAYW